MIPLQQILSKSNFSEYATTYRVSIILFFEGGELKEEAVNVAANILMPSHFFSSGCHVSVIPFLPLRVSKRHCHFTFITSSWATFACSFEIQFILQKFHNLQTGFPFIGF